MNIEAMRKINNLINFFGKIEEGLLILLFILLIFISLLQIVLRDIFSTGIGYADPIIRHLVLWIGLFGATLATKQDRHIHIDILPRIVPGRWKSFLQIAINSFSTSICIFLTYSALKFIKDEYQAKVTLVPHIPIWIGEVILPIAFFIMTIRFFTKTIKGLVSIFRGIPS